MVVVLSMRVNEDDDICTKCANFAGITYGDTEYFLHDIVSQQSDVPRVAVCLRVSILIG